MTVCFLPSLAGFRYPRQDIFVINADGSDLHQLTHIGDASDPVWSADSRQIAFARIRPYFAIARQREGITASIWTIRLDARGARQLTPTVAGQGDQPSSFSPEDRWLAFTRTKATQAVGRSRTPVRFTCCA